MGWKKRKEKSRNRYIHVEIPTAAVFAEFVLRHYSQTSPPSPLRILPPSVKNLFFVFPKALFYGTVAGGEIARNEIGLT